MRFALAQKMRGARLGVKPLTLILADVPRQNVLPPNLKRIQIHRLTC